MEINLDELHDKLLNQINLSTVDKEICKTVTDKQFPGGIIPSGNSFYVIAMSQKEFKILVSLLNSFIGKNYSNFDGHIINLDTSSQIEKLLVDYDISLVSKFDVPVSLKDTIESLISKMINIYKTSSYNVNSISLSIGKLIDDFKESIYITKDINNAKNIISKIKQEHRLDALNITFMEIELAYAFQNWDTIINHKLIYQIIHARKPLIIRLHIIEAFYYTYISNSSNIKEDYSRYIKPNILNLLTSCPKNAKSEIKYMYFLAYSLGDLAYTNISSIINDYLDNPLLSDKNKEIVENKLSSENRFIENSNDSYLSTKASIIEANNIDTLEKIDNVKEKLENLKDEEKEDLSSIILSSEIDNDKKLLPKNWIEWIDLLAHKEFNNSFLIAEKGLEEWDINILTNDPVNIFNLCIKINSLEKPYSLSRFIFALPLFIESLKRSDYYPNSLCIEIYTSILEVISIYEIQDQKTLILSQDIFESLLTLSPNSNIYNNIIEKIEIIIKRINGKNYVDCLIDFAELIISYNATEVNSRNNLLELILMQVYENKDWLEEFQLDMLIKLSSVLDLNSLFENLILEKELQIKEKFEKYIGKTIGIYTLSESAGKNAKEYLEGKIDNVRVILNHDKAATTILKHVVEVSDYMVIVTQSTKHAVTGEIQKIRRLNNKEVLFPLGKGSSSIIQCLLNRDIRNGFNFK